MAQSELEMEKQLVEQLANSGYEVLEATNESSIVENFRQQLGYHNRKELDRVAHDQLRVPVRKPGGASFGRAGCREALYDRVPDAYKHHGIQGDQRQFFSLAAHRQRKLDAQLVDQEKGEQPR